MKWSSAMTRPFPPDLVTRVSELQTQRRIVIFTASPAPAEGGTPSTIEHIEAIAQAFPAWTLVIIHERPTRRKRRKLRSRLRKVFKNPVSYPLEVAVSVVSRYRRLADRPAHASVGLPQSLEDLKLGNVEYHRCESLHAQETLQFVAGVEPWLGISIDAPVLKRSLFAIPQLGTVNIHKSLLPNYRGMPPGFWELAEKAREAGVTVHWIDERLDSGPIVLQLPLTIPPYSTPAGLAAELDLLASTALVHGLRRLAQGQIAGVPQQVSTRLYRRPDWMTARRVRREALRRRFWNRNIPHRARELVKTLILLKLLLTIVPLRNLVRRLRGTAHVRVILFHRVSDSYHDSVTVGVEQFQSFLKIIKRRYDVLDMAEFLASRGAPRRRPAVVLTFDDGYRDNYLAALLLRREGIPCTFFVATRIVGDADRAFPHDLKKLGHGVPALSWEQIQQMVRWGFQISNHTSDHLNLADASLDDAVENVRQAASDLTGELGDALPGRRWLAYPYGKADDITPEVRERLPELGITHCFSAFGGTNPVDFDEWNILRQNVDCNFGPIRFVMALEGWRTRSASKGAAHRPREMKEIQPVAAG